MDYIIEVRTDNKKKTISAIPKELAMSIKNQWVAWKDADQGQRKSLDVSVDLDEWVGSVSDIKMIYKDDTKRIAYDTDAIKKAEQENKEWNDPINIESRRTMMARMRKDLEGIGFFNTK